MSDREAFEAGIRDDPDNQLRRDIYADWLEENDFPEEAVRQRKFLAAKKWLTDFAAKYGGSCNNYFTGGYDEDGNHREEDWEPWTFETVVQAGVDYAETGDYLTQIGAESARNNVGPKFWQNWAIVTGMPIPGGGKRLGTAPFSCSC